jgi:hypothetical protein
MGNTYIAYGLKINSFCVLPGMEAESKIDPPYDINITLEFENGEEPKSIEFRKLSTYLTFHVFWSEKYYEIRNENSWKIWVSNDGANIIIDDKSKDMTEAINSILNTGLGLSLTLKGYLIFHAAAFAYEDKVSGIVGDSGKGKSTTIFNCLCHDLLFLTDDLLPIMLKDKYMAYPSMNVQMKMNLKSLQHFINSEKKHRKVRIGSDKYWISIPKEKRLMTEKPIDKLYFLDPYLPKNNENTFYSNEIKDISIKRRYLYNHSFGVYLLSIPDKRRVYTEISIFANSIKIYNLRYSKNFETMNTIVDNIFKGSR